MAKQWYEDHRFQDDTWDTVYKANDIIEEYQGQGFDLTLRQLYYQMVARGFIENSQRSYKRLGNIVSNARRAGILDWDAIVDRTRFVRERTHWDSPAQIVQAAVNSYNRDHWEGQPYRVEVWIEKDALVGVIAAICNRFDAPYFACRGYVSDSEMREAGQRIVERAECGQRTLILHLGDHDPSGIDMSRDIAARLALFSGLGLTMDEELECLEYYSGASDFGVLRLALNMDQVEQYNPPPNPAKLTDSRVDGYIERYGTDSWELDALDPHAMSLLIEQAIRRVLDVDEWNRVTTLEREHRQQLQDAAASLDLS